MYFEVNFIISLILYSMEGQLADFERRNEIANRWTVSDKAYVDARKQFLIEQKQQLQASLWSAVVKRQYLLKMKAKYAGTAL